MVDNAGLVLQELFEMASDLQIDLSRPECVARYDRIKELDVERRRYAEMLASATSHEQRKQILHTIEGLDNSISILQDELYSDGCYVSTGPPIPVLQVIGLEATQSTQYNAMDGTGAGSDNSVWLTTGKPLLIRVYLENRRPDRSTVTGRLTVMGFNNTTLQYDIFRRNVNPIRAVTLQPNSRSRRPVLGDTLNFLVPAGDCYGTVSFNAVVWVSGHESDPYFKHEYRLSGLWFSERRIPILHCFRIDLTQTVPGAPAPLTFAAPSFADCQATTAQAERMFPVSDLDVRDRGVRGITTQLQNLGDYDTIRAAFQTIYDGTTPTPARNELFAAILPAHQFPAGGPFGTQLSQSLQSTVNFPQLFAHELGHWLLPGDDHVRDAACVNPFLPMTQVDASYPDYPNASQRAGIGEWGADLGAGATPQLHHPETPDIMSYCPGARWISPYNYRRAFNGPVLGWTEAALANKTEGQKLLLAFRVNRDETVKLRWALHLPGEPPPQSAKGLSDLVLELHGQGGTLLTSTRCRRPADRPTTAPHEDFQEVVPWFEEVVQIVLLRGHNELARWPIEDAVEEPLISGLTVTEVHSREGDTTFQITWEVLEDAPRLHYMLRFTPDDGQTWIPLTNEIEEPRVDIEAELLRGIEGARFQLAVSTGFRTTLIESDYGVAGPPLKPEVTIIQPEAGVRIEQGDPVWLVGATTTRLDGSQGLPYAYWTSNRDGFLADGLQAVVSELSLGRHVLRLVAEDRSGGEVAKTVVISVVERSGAPQEETVAGA
jgi:hypothetical protein